MASKGKGTILNILLAVCGTVFIISTFFLYKEAMAYKEGSDEYSQWSELANLEEYDAGDPLRRVINFEELKKTNSDLVGWIYIPGTVVDYPVVQTVNNDKYLNTLFSGARNKAGAIFADYRNKLDFNDDNTLIYGHNMRNKSMFHILQNYNDQGFYDKNKIVYYYSPDGTYELRIFSAYTVHASDPYTEINFGNDYVSKVNTFIDRSEITSAYVVGPDAKIVTLSTCVYDYDDARFIVHATVHKKYYGEQ